jgi:uncharacterized protein (TIRG00374 family)
MLWNLEFMESGIETGPYPRASECSNETPSEPRFMTKQSRHPVRALLINAVLIVLAFSLLGAAIWNNRAQLREVIARGLDARIVALAFAIYMTSFLLTFVRWWRLVRVIEPGFTLHDAALLGFIGNLFNLVIPGAIGGDLIKAGFLARMRVNRAQAIASMVIDRILGLLGLFLLAGIAGAAAWPLATPDVRKLIVIVWIAIAAGFLGLVAIFNQALTRRHPELLKGHGRLAKILVELSAMSTSYRKRIGVLVLALGLSVLVHVLNVVAFYTISRTIFPSGLPSLGQHFLLVPLTLFTTAVPLPFGALGLSEQVSAQLFQLVHHPGGALAMMGFRVLMYGGGLVCAGVYLARIRQVRALTAEAEHIEDDMLEEQQSDLQEDSPPVDSEADQPEGEPYDDRA